MSRRIGEELNEALHAAFAADPDVYLLGEDIADPYGGAFRVTKGLSSAYPDRVLTTPISENGIMGVAGGLALCGNRVIVEVMFGDFLALAFDQVLNFITKSVSMYGTTTPMRVVVRCPVGGGRGYGPTHSQSMQKHFIGIPHLALYELSPFHDPRALLPGILTRTEPAILFEDKVLYTRRRYGAGRIDDLLTLEHLGGPGDWAYAHAPEATGPTVVLVSTGGTAHRSVEAAVRLIREDGFDARVLVPGRLYPVDAGTVLPVVADAASVWVVEESTAGGTWGAEVATLLHDVAWEVLRQPVRLVHSADRIIPAAPHLERGVLVQADTIRGRVLAAHAAPRSRSAGAGIEPLVGAAAQPWAGAQAAATAPLAGAAAEPLPTAESTGVALRVPKLNNNDVTYVLVEWLVEDGTAVDPEAPVAVVETSKATEEIVAESAGVLRIVVQPGAECAPGEVIAHLTDGTPGPVPSEAVSEATGARSEDGTGRVEPRPPDGDVTTSRDGYAVGTDPDTQQLSRAQRQVAAVVASSHRDIPAAFSLVRVAVDAALEQADRLADVAGPIGLAELVIKAIGNQRKAFPLLFGSLVGDSTVRLSDGVHVAVTVDSGNGLFLPVLRGVEQLDLADIGDLLVELRLKALRGTLREDDSAGANIALSLNQEPGVLFVQPIIPPGLAGIVSLTGISVELGLTDGGDVVERQVVGLGLAYDHRLVNGREANAFLAELRRALEEPGWVALTR